MLNKKRFRVGLVRVWLIAAGALAFLVGSTGSAEAHAVLSTSDPPSGAELGQPPAAVVLVFTEEVDVSVSSVRVLDTNGRDVARGNAELGRTPKELRLALAQVKDGVYTVTWRVLSKVDGHVTGGAFAFGVGVAPSGVEIPKGVGSETPGATPLSVTSRVLIYAGMVLLLGASVAAVAVSGRSLPRAFTVAWGGFFLLISGIGLFAESLRSQTGATYRALLGTTAGRGIIWRFAGLAIAGAALFATRRRRGFWWGVIAGSVGIVVAHVFFGHAGAGTLRILKVAAQTVHISAVSVWIGGLATLLVAIPGVQPGERSRVVRRFSTAAGIALALVVATGTVRALYEVGSWGRLTSTGYGRAVLIKIGLLVVLALLGAVNRYRNVARADKTIRGLRRVGSAELMVALVVLVITGLLTSLAPARLAGSAATGAKPSAVVAEGADFATTVRARLEVTPGKPGPNRFTLRLSDYDSQQPIAAGGVTLDFRYPVPSLIQPSTLELRGSKGVYRGLGSNLALGGPWLVDVLIAQENTSTELTLTVSTVSEQKVEVVPGDPTLYTVTLPGTGSVQLYVDPASPGRNEVHATYFDSRGAELPAISNAFVVATPRKGDPKVLPVRFLSPGHFIADGDLSKGKWRFDAIATGPNQEQLHVYFEHTIRRK